MAKRRKSQKAMGDMAMPSHHGPRRVDSGVEEAENGYIVRVSSDNLKKGRKGLPSYESKVYIAPTHEDALRISTGAIQRLGAKIKGPGKKGNKKRAFTKR